MIQIAPLQAGGGFLSLTSVQLSSKSILPLSNYKRKTLNISQQRQELDHFAAIICAQIIVEGPFTKVELDAMDKITHIIYSQSCITHENMINYLFDQGMF